MNEKLFEALLAKPEGKTIDFKSENYGFAANKDIADSKFIKDLLAFCNTVREETAYIILGVREETNGQNTLLGLSQFEDDAILQQKAASKITPKPHFSSYRYTYQNKVYGVIEVPVFPYERPLIATIPMKSVLSDTIYLRRGSSNSEATFSEINRLQKWMGDLHHESKSSNGRSDLIKSATDQKIPLSETLGLCLAYSLAHDEKGLGDFCSNELTGYAEQSPKGLEAHSFRVLKIPATPYSITIPDWQMSSADRMISHMMESEDFQEVTYFYSYNIFEVERALDSMKKKNTLVTIKYPVQHVFLGFESNTPMATLFIGPQEMSELYNSIRKQLLIRLTGHK